MCRGCREVVKSGWQVVRPMDALPANRFIICLYMFRALCVHRLEVKIVLHSIWYLHTETSEWSEITKIQFYKYEQIVVKFMCEFFECDYCVTIPDAE